jgi:hypothetical protein
MSAFASASAIEPLCDGAWGATCDGAWSTEVGVNGGFLAAVVLSAMMAIVEEPVLAVFRSHTSAHGFFEEDGELWSRDGVLLAQSRQLALLLGAAR